MHPIFECREESWTQRSVLGGKTNFSLSGSTPGAHRAESDEGVSYICRAEGNGVFSIFIFFKNVFYRNIFLVSQFTVLYPYRPAGGAWGLLPVCGAAGPLPSGRDLYVIKI